MNENLTHGREALNSSSSKTKSFFKRLADAR